MVNILFFLSLYLPFQLALNPSREIDLASIRVIILALFFLWLFESLRRKRLVIKNNMLTACVVFFLFLSAFSAFFSRNMDWSARKIFFLFSIFPLYFIVSSAVNSQEKSIKIIKGLVASGLAASIIGIIQFFSQFVLGVDRLQKIWASHLAAPFLGNNLSQAVMEYPSWLVNISGQTYFRAISVFPDPHMFSLYLGLLLPIALALFLKYKHKFWLVASGGIFLADILTFSRGAYFGLAAGCLFFGLIFMRRIKPRYRLGLTVGITVAVCVMLLPGPISSRLFSSFNTQEGSNSGRIMMWQRSAEIIAERPLTGTGIGNFSLAINPLAGYREPYYAHNTYLDIASESGLLAALAWIGIIFFSCRNFLKTPGKDILNLGAAASVAIFAAHSFFDTGIYSPVVLSLALIIFALSNVKDIRPENI